MRFITFTTVAAIFAHSAIVLANESPSPTVGPTETPPPSSCYTLTTAGPTCPVYSCSALPACLALSTITQSCGCASIYTTFSCSNPCTNTCAGTSYITVAVPACPTPPPDSSSSSSSHASYPTDSITITTDSSTTTAPPETLPTETSTIESSMTRYGNSTITSTNIITITTCPASVTCTGQTTTWTSTSGPFPCTASPTCTCILPGGGGQTLTGPATQSTSLGNTPQSTSQGNTPPQPTTSIVPAGAGKSVVVGGGLLAGLIAAVGLL